MLSAVLHVTIIPGNQSFLGFLQSFLGEITGGNDDYSKVSRGLQLGDDNPKSPGYFKKLTGNRHLAGCLFQ